MNSEWVIERDQKREEWFCGNQDAVKFVTDFMNCAETWDDLIDEDYVPDDRIHDAFERALIGFNTNPFFVNNRLYLMAIIIHTINAYHDSEILKTGNEREKFIAFHLRNFGLEVYQACALLTGGYEHLRKVSPEMRSFFCFENYSDWVKENG